MFALVFWCLSLGLVGYILFVMARGVSKSANTIYEASIPLTDNWSRIVSSISLGRE